MGFLLPVLIVAGVGAAVAVAVFSSSGSFTDIQTADQFRAYAESRAGKGPPGSFLLFLYEPSSVGVRDAFKEANFPTDVVAIRVDAVRAVESADPSLLGQLPPLPPNGFDGIVVALAGRTTDKTMLLGAYQVFPGDPNLALALLPMGEFVDVSGATVRMQQASGGVNNVIRAINGILDDKPVVGARKHRHGQMTTRRRINLAESVHTLARAPRRMPPTFPTKRSR